MSTSATCMKRIPSLLQTAQSRELAADNLRNTPLVTNTGKRKAHPRTGHEGPDREQVYSCNSSFNLGARWGRVVNATLRPL